MIDVVVRVRPGPHGHELPRWVHARPMKLIMDGVVLKRARHTSVKDGVFKFQLESAALREGRHLVQAQLQLPRRHSAGRSITSNAVSFLVDRTPPRIVSVFPSNGLSVPAARVKCIVVQVEDDGSGVDPQRSKAVVNGQPLKVLKVTPRSVTFSADSSFVAGSHKLRITMLDRAGNRATLQTGFQCVRESPGDTDAARAEKVKHYKELTARLKSDKSFQTEFLMDPRSTVSAAEFPNSKLLGKFLPPSLPRKHAEFLTSRDPEQLRKTAQSISDKVQKALANRDNARLAAILKRLKRGGPITSEGGLSDTAKEVLASALADPLGTLADLGIKPTAAEQRDLCPPMPETTARAFADWLSNSLTTQPRDPSQIAQTRTALRQERERVKLDPDRRLQWLTDPQAALAQAAPEARALDFGALPPPMTRARALQLVSPAPAPATTPPANARHNSSDSVVAVSIQLINEIFRRLTASTFPWSPSAENVPTGLPAPFDRFSYGVHVDQPDLLGVTDAAKGLLSTTALGVVTATLPDATRYEYELRITTTYRIFPDPSSSAVYLEIQDIDVHLVERGAPPNPELSAAISTTVQELIAHSVPTPADRRIELFRQSDLAMSLPLASAEVELHRIVVFDDQDPLGSGEHYYNIGIGPDSYVFGQFDPDSGSSISLDRTYLVRGNVDSFALSIHGIDVDFPDANDDLGSAMRTHYRGQEWQSGRQTLMAHVDVVHFELVLGIIDFVWRVYCWLEEVVVAIFNACSKLLGFETRIESRCTQIREAVMGWVTRANTESIQSFALEYTVRPVAPIPVASRLVSFTVRPDALYLGFDTDIPGVPDVASKSHAEGFLQANDWGVAVSENFLTKLLQAQYRYSGLLRMLSGGFPDLHTYYSLDFGPATIRLTPGLVEVHVPIPRGVAGINYGIHIECDPPTGATGYLSVTHSNDKLVFRVEKMWFEGDNLLTWVANLIASFYNGLSLFIPRTTVAIDSVFTMTVMGRQLVTQIASPLVRVTDDEVIVGVNIDKDIFFGDPPAPKPTGSGILLIANNNRRKRELHRVDCAKVERIVPAHRLLVPGSLEDIQALYHHGALPLSTIGEFAKQGYDGCYHCMPAKHWK